MRKGNRIDLCPVVKVLAYNIHYTPIRNKTIVEASIFDQTEDGPDHLNTFLFIDLGRHSTRSNSVGYIHPGLVGALGPCG